MGIPLVRAQHLIHYIEILREIGAPVDRHLERARLPVWISEMPDEYISLPRALDWVGSCSREASVMELGYIAAQKVTFATLTPDLQRALVMAPTGFARVTALAELVQREDSVLKIAMRREGSHVRIICEMPGFENNPSLGFAEWLNIDAVVKIVRSAAGPDWQPDEITFVSRGRPSDTAYAAYGNTRIMVDHPHASVLVDAAALAWIHTDHETKPIDSGVTTHRAPTSGLEEEWDFVSRLGAIVRPYLRQGQPDLSLVAEIACVSKRTLQRRLAQCGCTYSDIVAQARLDIASNLLADSSLKIVDIALTAGYENAQHFSRAFRRMTAMTPGDYRRSRTFAGAT